MPIQSCITYIEKLDEKGMRGENYNIHGYAYSSKPFIFPRVDVTDGDKHGIWRVSISKYHEFEKFKWSWCWERKSKDDLPCEVKCRAVDDDGNIQPEEVSDRNIRGLANNSVHKEIIR